MSSRIVILALIACSAVAHAQVPSLDGHRYVPSSLVTWSFVDTEVSSTSQGGVTDFVIEPNFPTFAAPIQLPRQLDGRFLSATQTIAGSFALADIFALTAQLSGGGIVPLDASSALVLGGHGAVGEVIGGALRLLRTDSFQLTLRADFDALEVESIIPARLPSSLRVSGHVLGVRPALAAAFTPTPRVGLQGSVTVEWQDFDVATTDDITTLAGAIAASVSLDPAPLTLIVATNVLHEFGRDVSSLTAEAVFGPVRTDWNMEGGVYFTVRNELDLGLLFGAELAAGDHNERLQGSIRLGYYF